MFVVFIRLVTRTDGRVASRLAAGHIPDWGQDQIKPYSQ